MSIPEYQTYYGQQLQKKIIQYIEQKYNNSNYIICWFDLYHINVNKKNNIHLCPEKTILKREDYITLLSLILKHPEITFQELPRYIPERLYVDLLYYLRFPTTSLTIFPHEPRQRTNPIAVEMTTLQCDAYAIAGDEPYSFYLYSYAPQSKAEEVYISIWMKQMEIYVKCSQGDNRVSAICGMIDVEVVKKALRVKTYKGIEKALSRMNEDFSSEHSDSLWLIRWLDYHRIHYVHVKEI